jgi:hypothetical protein
MDVGLMDSVTESMTSLFEALPEISVMDQAAETAPPAPAAEEDVVGPEPLAQTRTDELRQAARSAIENQNALRSGRAREEVI